MKLQKNTRLALYSVLEFAAAPGRHVAAFEIAEKYGVSPHHLAKVLSELAREALTGNLRGGEIAETPSFYGFEPFPHRGPAISNTVIDQLREDEPE